jgi:hypothetical protein
VSAFGGSNYDQRTTTETDASLWGLTTFGAPGDFWWLVLAAVLALLPTELTVIYLLFFKLKPATDTVTEFSDEFSDDEWRKGIALAARWVRAQISVDEALARSKSEEDAITRSVDATATELERMN